MPPGEYHPAFEEYCECIFELNEDDIGVIQARIAERLSVSRPSVSEMIKRLEAGGLVTTTEHVIKLTADVDLAERHRRRRLVVGAGDGVAVRAGGGLAQHAVHGQLDAVGDDVLPLAGLLVGLGPRQPEDVGEEALGQAVAADDRLGEGLAVGGEVDAPVDLDGGGAVG